MFGRIERLRPTQKSVAYRTGSCRESPRRKVSEKTQKVSWEKWGENLKALPRMKNVQTLIRIEFSGWLENGGVFSGQACLGVFLSLSGVVIAKMAERRPKQKTPVIVCFSSLLLTA